MPRYNVNYKDKWACFSSISDGFITQFMSKCEYEEWRKIQYGIWDYKPAEQCNMMTLKNAVSSVRLNRTHDEALDCLLECGISKDEGEKLLYDIETEYWCPISKGDGKYECPNCNGDVEEGQISCNVESCGLEFVWRT